MKDLYSNIKITQPLNPVVSTTTKTSAAIDLQGYNSVSVVFAVGLSGDTLSGTVYWTLKLTHSDDDLSYSDVTAAELISASAATVVIDDPTEDELSVVFGYRGSKRYVKAVATPTGTHSTGTPIGILALRGHSAQRPVA